MPGATRSREDLLKVATNIAAVVKVSLRLPKLTQRIPMVQYHCSAAKRKCTGLGPLKLPKISDMAAATSLSMRDAAQDAQHFE